MKTYVLVLLFTLCTFSNDANGLPTDGGIEKPGYYEIPGTYGLYKYHDTASGWDDAAATCTAEGATLYYAENANEFHNVLKYWQGMRSNFTNRFYVGIKKSGGVFKTINGTPISSIYQGWLSNEPNNAKGNEDCVEVAFDAGTLWGLNDEICNERRTFICKSTKIEGQSTETTYIDSTTECNIGRSSGYHNIPGANGLYKYNDTVTVWDDAAATCAAEGANLYYAENDNEFDTVFKYWKTRTSDFPVHIFMGIRKMQGDFKTINGTAISHVYNSWRSGEPNNAKRNEDCVEAVITETGAWGLNDEDCHFRRTFVCKLPMINKQCSLGSTTESNIGRSSGYNYIPGANGLYKYHDTASVWEDAAATCAAEGASLYYAESDNEFNTVFNYWKTMRSDFSVHIFMGIQKLQGVFKTINGTPISNVYNNWRSGEPNNAKGNEDCVEAVITETEWGLNDELCNLLRTFVCKLAF